MRLRLSRSVRVRVGRRALRFVPRGTRVLVSCPRGLQLAIVLHANGALHVSTPPRGWSLEAGHRVAGADEFGAAAELWITVHAPKGARVEFQPVERRRGSR